MQEERRMPAARMDEYHKPLVLEDKNSGYGKELSHFGAHAFVKAQTVWIANF
jgi:hypothetical protein